MPSLRATSAATRFLPLLLPLALACGDSGGPDGGPVVDCDQTDPVQLSVGEFITKNPAETACVRIPAAGVESVMRLGGLPSLAA